jgi:hypothetical protein
MTLNKKTQAAAHVMYNIFSAQGMDTRAEKPKGRSMTEPDKSTESVREIYNNALMGVDPLGQRGLPVYNEDFEVPDIRTLDPTDISEMRQGLEAVRFKLKREVEELGIVDGRSTKLQEIEDNLKTLADHAKKQTTVEAQKN